MRIEEIKEKLIYGISTRTKKIDETTKTGETPVRWKFSKESY